MLFFEWLNSKRGDFFIQDSHSSPESEIVWQEQWGGKIFFSHGESNSRGVAVLIAPDTDIKIHSISHDQYGRYLLLDCTL